MVKGETKILMAFVAQSDGFHSDDNEVKFNETVQFLLLYFLYQIGSHSWSWEPLMLSSKKAPVSTRFELNHRNQDVSCSVYNGSKQQ